LKDWQFREPSGGLDEVEMDKPVESQCDISWRSRRAVADTMRLIDERLLSPHTLYRMQR
jgi:hypothetical protein